LARQARRCLDRRERTRPGLARRAWRDGTAHGETRTGTVRTGMAGVTGTGPEGRGRKDTTRYGAEWPGMAGEAGAGVDRHG